MSTVVLADLLSWPTQVLKQVEESGALQLFAENLNKLVVTSSYSGIGSAEVMLHLLSQHLPAHLRQGARITQTTNFLFSL